MTELINATELTKQFAPTENNTSSKQNFKFQYKVVQDRISIIIDAINVKIRNLILKNDLARSGDLYNVVDLMKDIIKVIKENDLESTSAGMHLVHFLSYAPVKILKMMDPDSLRIEEDIESVISNMANIFSDWCILCSNVVHINIYKYAYFAVMHHLVLASILVNTEGDSEQNQDNAFVKVLLEDAQITNKYDSFWKEMLSDINKVSLPSPRLINEIERIKLFFNHSRSLKIWYTTKDDLINLNSFLLNLFQRENEKRYVYSGGVAPATTNQLNMDPNLFNGIERAIGEEIEKASELREGEEIETRPERVRETQGMLDDFLSGK
jgi:hypothetical protein